MLISEVLVNNLCTESIWLCFRNYLYEYGKMDNFGLIICLLAASKGKTTSWTLNFFSLSTYSFSQPLLRTSAVGNSHHRILLQNIQYSRFLKIDYFSIIGYFFCPFDNVLDDINSFSFTSTLIS